MLKGNFGESHSGEEPQAKRPNFELRFVNNLLNSSQNENNVRIPPSKHQNPTKSNILPIQLLEKKPIDKNQFFDNVLDYFEKEPAVDSGSNKQNIGFTKPVIIDSNANDPPPPKSNNPNDVQLPQMLLNKARLNTPVLKNPPDNAISDQTPSGPKVKKGVRKSKSSNGKSSPSKKKSPKQYDFLSSPFPQMHQPECCIIDKLIKRFQTNKAKPLPENDLYSCIEVGRPTPPIPGLAVSVNLYDHHLWIAGCPTLGGLYCWVCLLFSTRLLKTQNSAWVREGFRAINLLGTSMTKHMLSIAHKEAESIKDKMIQNRSIPNCISGGCSASASKPVSTTANNRSINVQNKANNSLSSTEPVSSTTDSQSINLLNKVGYSLPATEPVSITSNQSINIQNFPNEDGAKKASFESRTNKIKHTRSTQKTTRSNTKNHIETSQLGSSTGLIITNNSLKECNPAVPSAGNGGEDLAPQAQSHQPTISDLMNSENCERSSFNTEELPRNNDSAKEYLAQYDVSKAQYLILMKELEMKEQNPQLSVNNKKQPPGKSLAHTADSIKLPSTLRVVDLAILQARFFLNGTFNGSENLRELLITAGRPMPEMPGLAQEVNGVIKHFNVAYYDKFPWMCGSAEMNRLFCWPCFMFKDQKHNSFWDTVGCNNVANLSSLAESHSNNQTHLERCIRLKMVESSSKNKYQKTVIDPAKHNETACQKRSLMKYLIDLVCLKKKQLLNSTEICHDDFNDFLQIVSNYDKKLKALLDPESPNYIADFTTNFVTNYLQEITKALKTILQQKIAEEVENSIYVSFILKTVKSSRIALILRYTNTAGEVHERFYKFIKIGFGLREDLLKEIVAEVYELKCSTKFVGISYDGGVLRPDEMGSFNSNLRKKLRAAYFFHYRDESFLALLQQSLSRTQFCRSFFCLVTEFGNFLQDNPRVKIFIERLECEMSREKPKNWDLKAGIIITICDHYSGITKFLDQVANRSLFPNRWTNQVVSQCSKFSVFLGLVETRLFLVLFSKVYVALYPVIEAFHGEFDAKYWKSATNEAYNVIMDIRICSFHEMCSEAEEMGGFGPKNLSSERTRLSTMFNDTVDWILSFIKHRAKYIDVWSYFEFPTKKIDSPVAKAHPNPVQFEMGLKKCFPFFDSQNLGSSLIFAHNHAQFRNKSASEIIQVMNEFDLKAVQPELYSFLLLILTVPQSSANVSRPASDRIATYVESKSHVKSADALLHLEKDLLSSVRKEEAFYNDVISELQFEFEQPGKLVEHAILNSNS